MTDFLQKLEHVISKYKNKSVLPALMLFNK